MRGLFRVLAVALLGAGLLVDAGEQPSPPTESGEHRQAPVEEEEKAKKEDKPEDKEKETEERARTPEEEVAAMARGEIDAADYGLIACTAEYNPVRCISSGRIYQNPCFAMNAGVEEYQLEYLHP
ncbi:hypothetical protein Emed_007024 [Eimeria media]